MRALLIYVIVFVGFSHYASAQLNAGEASKIDDLFKTWQQPNHPGGSIAIMKSGEIIYSKAFGLASLEYQIPNEPNTLYNAASVSKQFTALGIVLLHLRGKIDIDADINTYLPSMPTFEYSVTTRQMLHHTSGLRSLHALLGMAGWRASDVRTNEDLYRFMERQVDLNFKPNDEYLYSNTGYMFMAKMIENVTGENFVAWMKKEVFDPLGMTNTYVEGQYNRVVPNNATSYDFNNNTFERAIEFWDYVGSGNMHTTTTDLLTYLRNYTNPKRGWKDAFKMMQTIDNFNNGTLNKYAFGVNVDDYKGHKRIQHGGSIGGFRAYSLAYPEIDLQIAILTNFSSSNAGKLAGDISNILLPPEEISTLKKSKFSKPIKTFKNKAQNLVAFEGNYWSEKEFSDIKLQVINDTLRLLENSKSEKTLVPIDSSEFIDIDQPNFLYRINSGQLQITNPEKDTLTFQRYIKTTPTIEDLATYEGRYYSEELETFYDIYLEEGQLYSHHPRHGNFKIKVIKEDLLKGEYPFSFIEIFKDSQQQVTGIKVTNGRVKHAWFKKINF